MRFVDIPFPGKPFKLSTTVITQREWLQVLNTRPWHHWHTGSLSNVLARDSHPAVYVSWFDAVVFCAELNCIFPNRYYRLPTEAEWEFACFGDAKKAAKKLKMSQLDSSAWYAKNCEKLRCAHAVAAKQPNQFGLYDMHGNVWEWCQDLQFEKKTARRVLRGGSWCTGAADVATASRVLLRPGFRKSNVGFRVVVEPRV